VPAPIVLVDTGPLVSLFDPSDRDREACKHTLAQLRRSRRVTSLAVVTEASYLLDFSAEARQALLAFVAAGAVEIAEFTAADISRAAALMAKYSSLPMDLADATLVVLAERLATRTIFTLDRRDFGVYRVGRRAFRLVPNMTR
jgi:predicted nucleic acid-binding protein